MLGPEATDSIHCLTEELFISLDPEDDRLLQRPGDEDSVGCVYKCTSAAIKYKKIQHIFLPLPPHNHYNGQPTLNQIFSCGSSSMTRVSRCPVLSVGHSSCGISTHFKGHLTSTTPFPQQSQDMCASQLTLI